MFSLQCLFKKLCKSCKSSRVVEIEVMCLGILFDFSWNTQHVNYWTALCPKLIFGAQWHCHSTSCQNNTLQCTTLMHVFIYLKVHSKKCNWCLQETLMCIMTDPLKNWVKWSKEMSLSLVSLWYYVVLSPAENANAFV